MEFLIVAPRELGENGAQGLDGGVLLAGCRAFRRLRGDGRHAGDCPEGLGAQRHVAPSDGPALGLIGFEKPVPAPSLDHRGKLPGQVPRLFDAGLSQGQKALTIWSEVFEMVSDFGSQVTGVAKE